MSSHRNFADVDVALFVGIEVLFLLGILPLPPTGARFRYSRCGVNPSTAAVARAMGALRKRQQQPGLVRLEHANERGSERDHGP
jgi:hypothetical protein